MIILSFITRELSRNTGKRGYRHKQANRLADERHQKKNKAIKLTDSVKNYISEKLKEYWSPEQIMGRYLCSQVNCVYFCMFHSFFLSD
jgi:IS30 family transposase